MHRKKEFKKLKKQLQDKKCMKQPIEPTDIEHRNLCQCTDSNGEIKTLYTTQQEATAFIKQSIESLYTYPCPSQKGWHLSKR